MRRTLVAVLAASLPLAAPAGASPDIDIPWTMHRLDNGLTLVVHEDHKAPVVAVNIWYHVGSKDETPGRTGFAHLFEHLMFQGSENLPDEYLNFLQQLGATDLNGTTWFDRTNYFQTVPVTALDTVLFAESDRMGHFAGHITQAVLDEQRGVVKNEKRQGENQPYGKVFEIILKQLFPPHHPYSWETIGSMADLDAATLDDVREWFRTWYGPNNAVLAIAGDIDTDEAIARVEKYFGDIPPGPPLRRLDTWIPRHDTLRRQRMQDRVSQARLYLSWTGPQWGSRDAHLLELAAAILAGDKNSRLYQRLVYRDRLASDVELGTLAFEIAGISYLQVSANPGVALATIEQAIDEELARFRREGPTAREIERVRTRQRAAFLRGIEKVGGFVGKAGTLAESTVLGGSPDAWQHALANSAEATPAALRETVGRWLTDAPFVLEVEPAPRLAASDRGVDRSIVPLPAAGPEVTFPSFQRRRLDNGLTLIVVERPGLPVVDFSLVLDGGYAADQHARPGTANMTLAMLDEGTRQRDALAISEELALLGATLASGATLDHSQVNLSALLDKLDPALELYADVILNPVFPAQDLERLRQVYLAALSQEKTQPASLALRVMPRLLYGDGHPYAQPLTGTGTEDALRALSRDDLVRFHATWFKPNHATLIAVGPVTADMLEPKLERLFARWQPGELPSAPARDVQGADSDVLYLIDRPGAEQSVIFAGQLLPPASAGDDLAIETMNDVLGGQFTARLNMNLRETRHWSYGARTLISETRGERPLLAYAPVQKDRTADAIREIRREFSDLAGSRPATAEEVGLVVGSNTLSLPGRWESATSITAAIRRIVQQGLADDYWSRYPRALRALGIEQVNASARAHLDPDALIFVVVGDRAVIGDDLQQLGYREIRLLDADGNPL